jgi:hypothetical protein
MSSPRETLDATVLQGLQYWKHDNQGIILNKMELNPQNLKATAMRIPIPESTQKFFNQLPILDRKEMWGASWGLSNILVTWRLLVKSEEWCCCTAANISAIAAAGLRGFTFRAGCNCNKVPRVLSTSNGSGLINLSPCTIIDGSIVVHVPFLYTCGSGH